MLYQGVYFVHTLTWSCCRNSSNERYILTIKLYWVSAKWNSWNSCRRLHRMASSERKRSTKRMFSYGVHISSSYKRNL